VRSCADLQAPGDHHSHSRDNKALRALERGTKTLFHNTLFGALIGRHRHNSGATEQRRRSSNFVMRSCGAVSEGKGRAHFG
jgi:hypothetical protein